MCKIPDATLLLSAPNLQLCHRESHISKKIVDQRLPGVRVLIVNDELFLLSGYEQTLEEVFEVVTAENGLQAVQIVSSYPPDYFQAIILDLNMPIMDGYEACVLIDQSLHQRSHPNTYKTKIYALTADDSPETDQLVAQYPFTAKFSALAVDNEVARIKHDIQSSNQKVFAPDIIKEELECSESCQSLMNSEEERKENIELAEKLKSMD